MSSLSLNSRYLHSAIVDDAIAAGKMALISGPRQIGKTTLSKALLKHPQNYFSFDDPDFKRLWIRSPKSVFEKTLDGPVVLDEIHKDRNFKTKLKGIYDSLGAGDGIIVTGSARLDLYRKGGDSMLGRYLPYRLHGFSVAEGKAKPPRPEDILNPKSSISYSWKDLLALGTFPEPLIQGSTNKANRWSRLRIERLLFEDLRDLSAVQQIRGMEFLLELLPLRVGSLLSINNLREDLQVAHGTVKHWLELLEALYSCFLIKPYTKKIGRAVVSAPKLYLFDILPIPPKVSANKEAHGARLENLAALHIYKACQFWTDTALGFFELHYVRNKDGLEVDFLITRDKKPWMLIECKSSETQIAHSLLRMKTLLEPEYAVQLVEKPGYHRKDRETGIHVVEYERFFSAWV